MQVCLACKKQFVPVNNGTRGREQRFCSISCGLSGARVEKRLTCELCSAVFDFVGRTKAKYCPACRRQAAAIRSVRSQAKRGRIKRPGVGSGNNQAVSPNLRRAGDAPRKSRTSVDYRALALSHYGRVCGICGDAGSRLAVHHRDGDDTRHDVENLIPVCYSCHRRLHFVKVPARALEQRLQKLQREAKVKSRRKSGIPGNGQSEVKAAGNAAASRND